jgi:hypothetical protein
MIVHSASLRACRMTAVPFSSLNYMSVPVLKWDRMSGVHAEAVVELPIYEGSS